MEESIPKNRKEGHEFTIIIIGIVFFLIISKLFFSHSDLFFIAWKKIYYPQAEFIAWFSTTILGRGLNFLLGHTAAQAHGLVNFMLTTPINKYSGVFCFSASKFIGEYFLFIFVPIGGYLSFKTYCSTQGESIVYQRFNNANVFLKFTCGDSKKQNDKPVKKMPQVVNNNNVEQVTEIEATKNFIQKNQLLHNTKNKKIQLDTKKVFNCFAEQLGCQFTSLENLLKSSYGWVATKIFNYIPEKHHQNIIDITSKGHRYDSTVLVSILESARNYGVVPSAAFAHLKNEYPSLWYGLNNLGRKTAFAEGAGISAQYLYEIRLKNSSQEKPKLKSIDAAVKGLEEKFEQEKIGEVRNV